MAADGSDAQLGAFLSFLIRTGVKHDDAVIRFCKSATHGYGVTACAPINVGHTIATIPKTAILSVQTATLWQQINQSGAQYGDDVVDSDGDDYDEENDTNRNGRDEWCPPLFQLAAALLFETAVLGSQSQWHGYMELLPKSLTDIGVPMAYSRATLGTWFQGTGVDCLSQKRSDMLKDVFESCIRKLFAHRGRELEIRKEVTENVRCEQFLVAFGCVMSRAFQVDDYHGNSMVPVADMFNHRTDGEHVHIEGQLYDDDSEEEEDNDSEVESKGHEQGEKKKVVKNTADELVVACVREVRSGKEVFNTFGQKGNTVLYLNYGFTEADNVYDSALVQKDDMTQLLRAWCDEQDQIGGGDDCRMTQERQECIETASDVIEDETMEDYLQIWTDGRLCHGLWVMIYLHVVQWTEIAGVSEDDVEFLEHVMQVSEDDIMGRYGEEVREIVRRVVKQRMGELEVGCSGKEHDAIGTAAQRIRDDQRRALVGTYERFVGKWSGDSRLAKRRKL